MDAFGSDGRVDALGRPINSKGAISICMMDIDGYR